MQRRQYIDHDPAQEDKAQRIGVRGVLAGAAALAIVLWWGYGAYVQEAEPFKTHLSVKVLPAGDSTPEKPFLPDISQYTVGMIAAKVPPSAPGKIVLGKLNDYPEFLKFLEGDAPRRLRLLQRAVNPQGLVVAEGHYTWTQLYEEIHARDPEEKVIQKSGGTYLLRVPLLVLRGASLTISDADTDELRLSKQANAFLLNAGDMFILRTTVSGWDEEKQDVTRYTGDKKEYRPFITTWGGGGLYIAGSRIVSLGYLKGKSYGLSFSTCVPCLKIDPYIPPPTGAVVGSTFTDMYYGFYSYEAEDVAIVGNTYADNVIYGIDPHDRSRRLIIAGNEAYGTRKKHGIIVSREVNDSWIFSNYSHNNHGSGIMIDRTSVNNVIADNVTEHNGQDGITLFESENTTIWGNKIRNNDRSGVRIRNSWNVKMYQDEIIGNKGASIELYVADLSGQETRDFELDPYTQKADISVYGAQIQASGPAVFKMAGAVDFMSFSDMDVRAGAYLFPQSFSYDRAALLEALGRKDAHVEVKPGTGE